MKLELRKYSKFVVPLATILGLSLATQVSAIDTLPMTSSDPGAIGKVSSASLLKKGTYKTGFSIDAADLLRLDSNSTAVDSESIYGSGHQTFINFSYGISKNLELDLGLKGTTEVVKTGIRNRFYEDSELYSKGKENLKETGYAGARAMVKYRLIKNRGLSVVLATFAEEGLGEKGMFSVTRAQKARAGWMALIGYGQRGIGGINLNLGMRYQEPQIFGGNFIRNEIIARINVRGYLFSKLAVFGTLGGRRLMMASSNSDDFGKDGKPVYFGSDSAEVLGGVVAYMGLTSVSIYGGSGLKDFDGFGNAKNTYGLSLATKISSSKSRSNRWIAKRNGKKRSNRKSKSYKNKKNSTGSNSKYYDEMNGVVESVSFNSGPMDDFAKVRKRMKKQHRVRKSGITEQEEVERELNILQNAENKVQQAKLKRKRLAKQKSRRNKIRKSKRNGSTRKKQRKKARKYLEDEYSITVGDTEWNGLD